MNGWPVLQVRKDEFRGAVAGYKAQEKVTTGGGDAMIYVPVETLEKLAAKWDGDYYAEPCADELRELLGRQ